MPKVKETPAKTIQDSLDKAADQADLEGEYDASIPGSRGPVADTSDDWFLPLEEADDKINALLYGREGTGKTTNLAFMANTAPAGSKVLIINAEGGTKKSALAKRGVDVSKIVIWPKPGERASAAGLQQVFRNVSTALQHDPQSWYGVGFDSITEVVNVLVEDATGDRQERLKAAGKTFDPNLIDIADYGVMTSQLRSLVRRFRDLPCHFVATALERANDDPTKGPIGVGPAVTPAFAADLLGYMDLVLYIRATVHVAGEEGAESTAAADFRAITRPNKSYRAKDRFDVLPRVLAEPTFARIHGYVVGDLVEEEDLLQQEYNERRAKEVAEKAAAEAEKAARKAAAKGKK